MTQTKRLVFGDDRSPAADVAWLWINNHRWPGWTIDVAHVPVDSFGGPAPSGGAELSEWSPEVGRTLFAESEAEGIRHLTARADPRLVLERSADADLLVIGSVGAGIVKRWLHLGSTAEWLLHQPPCPLLIAKSASPVRRVLVCVDGSEPARRALDALLALPLAAHVEVLALGVYDGWTDPELALEVAAEHLTDVGIPHRTEQIRGRPTDTIVGVLTDQRPALVVLGTRGNSGLRRVVAGSTASAVARVASCNVLVTS